MPVWGPCMGCDVLGVSMGIKAKVVYGAYMKN